MSVASHHMSRGDAGDATVFFSLPALADGSSLDCRVGARALTLTDASGTYAPATVALPPLRGDDSGSSVESRGWNNGATFAAKFNKKRRELTLTLTPSAAAEPAPVQQLAAVAPAEAAAAALGVSGKVTEVPATAAAATTDSVNSGDDNEPLTLQEEMLRAAFNSAAPQRSTRDAKSPGTASTAASAPTAESASADNAVAGTTTTARDAGESDGDDGEDVAVPDIGPPAPSHRRPFSWYMPPYASIASLQVHSLHNASVNRAVRCHGSFLHAQLFTLAPSPLLVSLCMTKHTHARGRAAARGSTRCFSTRRSGS